MSLKTLPRSDSWKVTQPGVAKLDSSPGLSALHTPIPHCGAGPRACFPVYKDNQGLSDWGRQEEPVRPCPRGSWGWQEVTGSCLGASPLGHQERGCGS